MERMAAYCHLWRLKPSITKTVSSIFHLQNISAARELRVHIEGKLLRMIQIRYLGITLDRTLSYLHHLTKIAGNLQSRNNLAGSTWGANANTVRSFALALCYSVAEYCTALRMWVLSMLNCIPPCALYLGPFGQPLYHGCQFSPT